MPQLSARGRHPVEFTLNGKPVSGYAEPRTLLSDFMLHELGLTSMHVGCEHGVCGACTLRIDGVIARGCLTFAVQVDGRDVETVDSLTTQDGGLSDLQASFKKNHGLQCGYCTPGILMSVSAFLEENPKPSEEEVRDMLSGHLCRCTGYVNIVKAVMEHTGQA